MRPMVNLTDNDRITGPLEPPAGETQLATDFPVLDAHDLVVMRERAGAMTELALDADYAVSGLGQDTGATVTLASGAQAGDKYWLAGDTIPVPGVKYVYQQAFPSEETNTEIARLWMAIQERRRGNGGPASLSSPLLMAPGETSAILPAAAARAGKQLGFDSAGNPVPAEGGVWTPGSGFISVDSLDADTALTRHGYTVWDDGNVPARISAMDSGAPTGFEYVPGSSGKRLRVDHMAAYAAQGHIAHVSLDKRLVDRYGRPFIVRGVQFLTYLFVKGEYRANRWYRPGDFVIGEDMTLADGTHVTAGDTVTAGEATGVSKPTGYEKYAWISSDYVRGELDRMRRFGVNLIQIGVEPAMLAVPASIQNGVTYPSSMDLLDEVIYEASLRGMIVQLRNSDNESDPVIGQSFLTTLASRYKGRPNVWLNPCNEMNCGVIHNADGSTTSNPDCSTPAAWGTEMAGYVQAIRATGYGGVVVINPANYGGDISMVLSELEGSTVFTDDPNLVIGTHHYKRDGDTDFVTARWEETETKWAAGLDNRWCCLVDESGSTNVPWRIDPALEPDTPPPDPTEWADTERYLKEYLRWVSQACRDGRLFGVIAFQWGTWFPQFNPPRHDKNSLMKVVTDPGTLSGWGQIYYDYYLGQELLPLPRIGVRLEKVSGGVSLLPAVSNVMVVAGRAVAVPKGGVFLSTSGLTTDVITYIYAYLIDGNRLALEASTTGYVADEFTTLPRKSDDASRTLVGMVWRDGSVGAVNDARHRFVRSRWNEEPWRISAKFSADRTRGSATLGSINTEVVCEALLFGGEVLDCGIVAVVSPAGDNTITTGLSVNSSAAAPHAVSDPGASKKDTHNVRRKVQASSDGVRTLNIWGAVSAGTGTWASGSELAAELV